MYKITVCGNFGGNEKKADGQTVKTQNLYDELCIHYGKEKVSKIDTFRWKKKPIKLFLNIIKSLKNSQNIIALPAQNGVKVIIPLFININKLFNKKIYYSTIGAWLPDMIKEDNKLIKKMQLLDGIFVETENMKKRLNKLNINNVYIMKNFKKLNILSEEELILNEREYKLCTFSRVMQEKGITEAIKIVKDINNKLNIEKKCKLDIYGPINEDYKKEFYKLVNENREYVEYKGIIPYKDAVYVLKQYFLLLFPTKYKTEGIPGTIIDAYASGVPILASKWENFNEVIVENKTGFGYEFENEEDFFLKLENILKKPLDEIFEIKKNCLIKAKEYMPEIALKEFYNILK